jgi:hypothetical protein
MTTLPKIKQIAIEHDVRVSIDHDGEDCEGRKMRRIGLHGFLSAIQAVERQIDGYHVEKGKDGHYLTRK